MAYGEPRMGIRAWGRVGARGEPRIGARGEPASRSAWIRVGGVRWRGVGRGWGGVGGVGGWLGWVGLDWLV